MSLGRVARWAAADRADCGCAGVFSAPVAIEAYLQVAATELYPSTTYADQSEPFSTETLLHRTIARPVLSIAALCAAVRRHGSLPPSKEF